MSSRGAVVALLLVALIVAVHRSPSPQDAPLPSARRTRGHRLLAAAARGALPNTTAGCRLVALGDVHGDKQNAITTLYAAKVVDSKGIWNGGCATLVQVGDLVDRGANSMAVLDYFIDLQMQARQDGGKVVLLLGNHEVMNMLGDTGYVSPVELARQGGPTVWRRAFNVFGGRYGTKLLDFPVVANISGIVFTHAGILPEFAAMGVDGLNAAARANLLEASRGTRNGKGIEQVVAPHINNVLSDEGPTWTRRLIQEAKRNRCELVVKSLTILHAARMVVGHTINEDGRIHEYCGGRLVAIDVGLSIAIHGIGAAVEFGLDGTVAPIYVVNPFEHADDAAAKGHAMHK